MTRRFVLGLVFSGAAACSLRDLEHLDSSFGAEAGSGGALAGGAGAGGASGGAPANPPGGHASVPTQISTLGTPVTALTVDSQSVVWATDGTIDACDAEASGPAPCGGHFSPSAPSIGAATSIVIVADVHPAACGGAGGTKSGAGGAKSGGKAGSGGAGQANRVVVWNTAANGPSLYSAALGDTLTPPDPAITSVLPDSPNALVTSPATAGFIYLASVPSVGVFGCADVACSALCTGSNPRIPFRATDGPSFRLLAVSGDDAWVTSDGGLFRAPVGLTRAAACRAIWTDNSLPPVTDVVIASDLVYANIEGEIFSGSASYGRLDPAAQPKGTMCGESDAGAPMPTEISRVVHLATNGTRLFWTTVSGEVMSASLPLSPNETGETLYAPGVTVGPAQAALIAATPTDVFVSDGAAGPGAVWQIPLGSP